AALGVSVNALRVLKDLGSRFPDGNSLTIAIEQTLSLYYDIRRKRVRRLSAAGEAFDKSMLKTRPLAECMRYALFWTVNSFPNITSYESMVIIDGEFQRLREFREIKLDDEILAFLQAANSSLKSKGATNPRGPFKRSLIHYAAMGDCSELLRLLLKTGAAKDDRDQNRRTPLSWATEYGALDSVKILLECGAKVNSTDDMYSRPLSWLMHSGAATGQFEATEAYLRENGAKKAAKPHWTLRKIEVF
ncbi:hypothetical protein GB937_003398, partial [Aspergillus fischeri]